MIQTITCDTIKSQYDSSELKSHPLNQFGPSVESYKALSIRGEGVEVGAAVGIVEGDDEGLRLRAFVGVLESSKEGDDEGLEVVVGIIELYEEGVKISASGDSLFLSSNNKAVTDAVIDTATMTLIPIINKVRRSLNHGVGLSSTTIASTITSGP